MRKDKKPKAVMLRVNYKVRAALSALKKKLGANSLCQALEMTLVKGG